MLLKERGILSRVKHLPETTLLLYRLGRNWVTSLFFSYCVWGSSVLDVRLEQPKKDETTGQTKPFPFSEYQDTYVKHPAITTT